MTRLLPAFLAALLGAVDAVSQDAPLSTGQTARPGAADLSGVPALIPAPGGGTPVPVPPGEAFLLTLRAVDARTLAVRFAIDPCCYLYRDKTRFGLSTLDGTPLAEGPRLRLIELPPGQITRDEFYGTTEVYREGFEIRLPLAGVLPASEFVLDVGYQGCAEKGVVICYEPMTRRFPVRRAGDRLQVGAPLAAGTAGGRPVASPAFPAEGSLDKK